MLIATEKCRLETVVHEDCLMHLRLVKMIFEKNTVTVG